METAVSNRSGGLISKGDQMEKSIRFCQCGKTAILKTVKKIIFENEHVAFKMYCYKCGLFHSWPHRKLVKALGLEVIE